MSVRLSNAGIELIELCLQWRNRKLYVVFYYLKKWHYQSTLTIKNGNHRQNAVGPIDASISAVTSKAPAALAGFLAGPGQAGF